MTAHVIELGVGPVAIPRAPGRPRADTRLAVDGLYRRIAAAVLVVVVALACCGLAATVDWTSAVAAPPDGPAPGLGL